MIPLTSQSPPPRPVAQSSGSGGQNFPAGKLHRAHSKQRPEFSKGSGSMELLFLVLQGLRNSPGSPRGKKIKIANLGVRRHGEGVEVGNPGKHIIMQKQHRAPPSHRPAPTPTQSCFYQLEELPPLCPSTLSGFSLTFTAIKPFKETRTEVKDLGGPPVVSAGQCQPKW